MVWLDVTQEMGERRENFAAAFPTASVWVSASLWEEVLVLPSGVQALRAIDGLSESEGGGP